MGKARVRLLASGFVVSIGVLASACGGAATPGVATLSGNSSHGSTTSGTVRGGGGSKRQAAIKFSKCMRSHGVKNYPDPNGPTNSVTLSPNSGIDPNSPTFQNAQKACQSLLPKPSTAQIRKMEQNALKFSKCMRAHGVTNFPDPQFSGTGGGIEVKVGAQGGSLKPTSPVFQAAQQACSKYMHAKGVKGAPGKSQQTVRAP
jgi:hypothetical protein